MNSNWAFIKGPYHDPLIFIFIYQICAFFLFLHRIELLIDRVCLTHGGGKLLFSPSPPESQPNINLFFIFKLNFPFLLLFRFSKIPIHYLLMFCIFVCCTMYILSLIYCSIILWIACHFILYVKIPAFHGF
jgi:hypothetical protein